LVFGAPTDNDGPVETYRYVKATGRGLTCNSVTGDWLCAGWAGAWRCQCGSACYNSVCTCKRCI
ncbi:unnamed protein product, partial [Adineta steineri]